jgi:hypothetical protein
MNLASNAYKAPANMELSREDRLEIFKNAAIGEQIKHAKRCANRYANVVVNSTEGAYSRMFVLSQKEVEQVMVKYGVNTVLAEYAATVCLRLIKEKGVR